LLSHPPLFIAFAVQLGFVCRFLVRTVEGKLFPLWLAFHGAKTGCAAMWDDFGLLFFIFVFYLSFLALLQKKLISLT